MLRDLCWTVDRITTLILGYFGLVFWKTYGNKLKKFQKVKNVKRVAPCRDLLVTGFCVKGDVIPCHFPPGAFKLNFQINFKTFSNLSTLSKVPRLLTSFSCDRQYWAATYMQTINANALASGTEIQTKGHWTRTQHFPVKWWWGPMSTSGYSELTKMLGKIKVLLRLQQ